MVTAVPMRLILYCPTKQRLRLSFARSLHAGALALAYSPAPCSSVRQSVSQPLICRLSSVSSSWFVFEIVITLKSKTRRIEIRSARGTVGDNVRADQERRVKEANFRPVNIFRCIPACGMTEGCGKGYMIYDK